MSERRIEFLERRPWFGEDGAPRAGYGLVFRVEGHEVTIWVTDETAMNLGQTGEQARAREAAELFVKMQMESGWDPTVESALIFKESALQGWVRNRPEWKAGQSGRAGRAAS